MSSDQSMNTPSIKVPVKQIPLKARERLTVFMEDAYRNITLDGDGMLTVGPSGGGDVSWSINVLDAQKAHREALHIGKAGA